MSRKRKNREKVQHSPLAHSAENTHFRLCHFCLTLNESAEPIVQCGACKHFLTADVELVGLEPNYDHDHSDRAEVEVEEEDLDEDAAALGLVEDDEAY